MKPRMSTIFTVVFFVVIASLLAYLVLGTVPPQSPSEQDIKHGWTYWSLDTEPIIYGITIWSEFADNVNNSIKVYYCTYFGGFFHNFDAMSWETESGVFSSASLNMYDLLVRWDGSTAVLKFKFEDDFYKVSFSIPKNQNGSDKYSSLREAWEKEELHQIVEKW